MTHFYHMQRDIKYSSTQQISAKTVQITCPVQKSTKRDEKTQPRVDITVDGKSLLHQIPMIVNSTPSSTRTEKKNLPYRVVKRSSTQKYWTCEALFFAFSLNASLIVALRKNSEQCLEEGSSWFSTARINRNTQKPRLVNPATGVLYVNTSCARSTTL